MFEIYLLAVSQIDQLGRDGSYRDLPTFTQQWLRGRVSDYPNARGLMAAWGLVNANGNLSLEFVERYQEARDANQFADLRAFLRHAYRSMFDERVAGLEPASQLAALERLGEGDVSLADVRRLPGIQDEADPQVRRKREQCLAAVHDVIRYCDNRDYLEKEASPRSTNADRSGKQQAATVSSIPEQRTAPLSSAALPPAAVPLDRMAEVQHRAFNMRDERHQNVRAQLWFDVPAEAHWIEQLGLRLLDWADQLRERGDG